MSADSKSAGGELGGGLAVTGNYPGKARTADELRGDLEKALSLIPGRHRLNLHACYAELGGKKVERSEYTIAHFQGWVDWCKAQRARVRFQSDLLRASARGRRLHALASRRSASGNSGSSTASPAAGSPRKPARQLGKTAVTNFWIPDGFKDQPVDRKAPRERLAAALDDIFAEPIDPKLNLDAVESKLFGIGSESYVVGSHEFYLGYAITRQKLFCLDAGHFHPTESIADKISVGAAIRPGAAAPRQPRRALGQRSRRAARRSDARDHGGSGARRIPRPHFIGLDFFDASINRIAAWVIGTRNALKALLLALLEPTAKLREAEAAGDFTARLALLEELKTLPFGAVWDEHCRRANVPVGTAWLEGSARLREVCIEQTSIITRQPDPPGSALGFDASTHESD